MDAAGLVAAGGRKATSVMLVSLAKMSPPVLFGAAGLVLVAGAVLIGVDLGRLGVLMTRVRTY